MPKQTYKILEVEQIKYRDQTWKGMNYYAYSELYGKGYRHRKNTILVDKNLKSREKERTIRHEKYEIYRMRDKHEPYAKAHSEALAVEKKRSKIEKQKKGTFLIKRDYEGRILSKVQVTETIQNIKGRNYFVYRNKQGKQVSKKVIKRKEVRPYEKELGKKEGNYRYEIVIRVAYVSKRAGHSRFGEIYGTIISYEGLSDDTIINTAINEVRTKMDNWVTYVYPNQKVIVHIKEFRTDENESVNLSFTETH